MKKSLKQAFTLIELLVVIAIIGILSGLIVVAMGGVTQKASIAKAQVFSNSLRNALMLNLVSEWKFDEVNASTTTPDSWSGGNTGTLKENGYVGVCDSTHCPQLQTTGCISGNCLKFDGVNDYVDCGGGPSVQIGTSNFSIEFWANLGTQIADNKAIIGKRGGLWADATIGYEIVMSTSGRIYLHISDGTNVKDVAAYTTTDFRNKGWEHVVFNADRNGNAKSYVNGILEGTTNISGVGNITSGQTLKIGSRGDVGYWINGTLDEIRFYNDTISTSQIRERYYAGLNSLLINGSMSKEEYLSRIKTIKISKY